MNITAIQSIWRRIRRPSEKTLRELRSRCAFEILPPPAPKRIDPKQPASLRLSTSELNKYTMQNMALLYVLDSHDRGLSVLCPSALAVVRSALNRTGRNPSASA